MSETTHGRILEVSAELFAEQGYDATSLREIADRMGFTKAALYYHFQSKDDILKALVDPAFEILDELLDRLERATGVEEWADALEWVVTSSSRSSTSSGSWSATATRRAHEQGPRRARPHPHARAGRAGCTCGGE